MGSTEKAALDNFIKNKRDAHTAVMKITTIVCCALLILYGVFAAVYALTGFDILFFATAGFLPVYRALLSLAGVAALWLLFWLIAFRPTKFLS